MPAPRMMMMFDLTRFSIEVTFTLLIVLFCMVIYFATREIYSLSKHKGIRHFRLAFLFLGLSYLTRLVMQVTSVSSMVFHVGMMHREVWSLFLIPVAYFSTMAIFHLTYSVIWKRFSEHRFLIIANTSAFMLVMLTVFVINPFYLFLLQLLFLIFSIIIQFTKRFSKTRLIYILLLAFWLVSLFLSGPRRLIPTTTLLVLNSISALIFLMIYLKVRKWAR